jgi:lambda repressor-like predicted transcriptional regulator
MRGKAPRSRDTKKARSRVSEPTSDKSFEAKNRAFHVIARMRHDGLSLRKAAREESTTPATVQKYLPAALRRSKTGQWIATKSDRYVRLLSLPGLHGPITVRARGSEEAQFASAYLASLTRWQRSEKAYELAPFHGKKIGDFELITASRTLRALRDAGLLQLDSLYAALKDTV